MCIHNIKELYIIYDFTYIPSHFAFILNSFYFIINFFDSFLARSKKCESVMTDFVEKFLLQYYRFPKNQGFGKVFSEGPRDQRDIDNQGILSFMLLFRCCEL